MADFETMPVGTFAAVEKAARVFREYESSHRSKAARATGPLREEREEKATRNAKMAAELENLLARRAEGL